MEEVGLLLSEETAVTAPMPCNDVNGPHGLGSHIPGLQEVGLDLSEMPDADEDCDSIDLSAIHPRTDTGHTITSRQSTTGLAFFSRQVSIGQQQQTLQSMLDNFRDEVRSTLTSYSPVNAVSKEDLQELRSEILSVLRGRPDAAQAGPALARTGALPPVVGTLSSQLEAVSEEEEEEEENRAPQEALNSPRGRHQGHRAARLLVPEQGRRSASLQQQAQGERVSSAESLGGIGQGEPRLAASVIGRQVPEAWALGSSRPQARHRQPSNRTLQEVADTSLHNVLAMANLPVDSSSLSFPATVPAPSPSAVVLQSSSEVAARQANGAVVPAQENARVVQRSQPATSAKAVAKFLPLRVRPEERTVSQLDRQLQLLHWTLPRLIGFLAFEAENQQVPLGARVCQGLVLLLSFASTGVVCWRVVMSQGPDNGANDFLEQLARMAMAVVGSLTLLSSKPWNANMKLREAERVLMAHAQRQGFSQRVNKEALWDTVLLTLLWIVSFGSQFLWDAGDDIVLLLTSAFSMLGALAGTLNFLWFCRHLRAMVDNYSAQVEEFPDCIEESAWEWDTLQSLLKLSYKATEHCAAIVIMGSTIICLLLLVHVFLARQLSVATCMCLFPAGMLQVLVRAGAVSDDFENVASIVSDVIGQKGPRIRTERLMLVQHILLSRASFHVCGFKLSSSLAGRVLSLGLTGLAGVGVQLWLAKRA